MRGRRRKWMACGRSLGLIGKVTPASKALLLRARKIPAENFALVLAALCPNQVSVGAAAEVPPKQCLADWREA